MQMTSRERVFTALRHEEPDRVPFFIKYEPWVIPTLLEYFGVKREYNYAESILMQYNGFDAELARKMGEDCLAIRSYPLFNFKPKIKKMAGGWEERTTEWGTVIRHHLESRMSAMVDFPLKKASFEEMENHEFPDPHDRDFSILDYAVENYGDEFVVMGGLGCGIFFKAFDLRGWQQFSIDMIENPEFAERLLDRILNWDMEVAKEVLKRDIDVFYTNDDYGAQDRLFCNPNLWRKFIKPRKKKLYDMAKSKGLWTYMHSDGNLMSILQDIVDCGIDILNPIQPLAMDPVAVKRNFGDKLTLHTGVDVQRVLPFGTPYDVTNEVKKSIRTLAPGGGFIITPSHHLTHNIPLENTIAMVNAIRKYGNYPIR